MVTDRQVRRMREMIAAGKSREVAAAKTEMDVKTARKWERLDKLPSEVKVGHTWRTREDPFDEVWAEVRAHLEINAGLEAKTLFEALQRRYAGRFGDGQLRTLQRRVREWQATEGPPKEVFFAQQYEPGVTCESDFTEMRSVGVTLGGQRFDHLLYHFVLAYSNWETGSICFSESFESLSEGMQAALWELGGVPQEHCTDRMSTAVNKTDNPAEFTQRYAALLRHYGLEGRKIQTARPNEIGDVEQRHHRFKRAVEQSFMLRGSSDFEHREAYEKFLRKLFGQLNSGRRARFEEEREVLRALPGSKLDSCKRLRVKVTSGSTIRVKHNVYSVDSRLIGEPVNVWLYSEHLEVWYAQRKIEVIPRQRGEGKHHIQYRHIIDWLVRKPGAFEHYRYREDLFPTTHFRLTYDELRRAHAPLTASREYLRILELAAKESEAQVEEALRRLIHSEQPISVEAVKGQLMSEPLMPALTAGTVAAVDLNAYDALLSAGSVDPVLTVPAGQVRPGPDQIRPGEVG